jgi:hypothetical protein
MRKKGLLPGASSSATAKKTWSFWHQSLLSLGVPVFLLAGESAPSSDMVNSELLYNEPKYVRMDEGGLHTLESNGLEIKEGVYY